MLPFTSDDNSGMPEPCLDSQLLATHALGCAPRALQDQLMGQGGLGLGSSAGPAPAANTQLMQHHGQQPQPHVAAVQETEYDPEDPFGE